MLLCNVKKDFETLRIYHHDRDELIAAHPEVFFTTDHYNNYPSVLIRLRPIQNEQLKKVLMNAWLLRANKTHLKEYGLSRH